MRESRTLGSVRAKAEWLSYPTTTELRKEIDNRIVPQAAALH